MIQKTMQSRKHGFTLIEIIIYVGLFGIVVVGLFTASYPLFAGSEKNTASVTADGEVAFILRKIDWALSNASAITNPAVGAHGPALRATRLSGGDADFTVSGDSILLAENGGIATTLNASRVKISGFDVKHVGPIGTSQRYVEVVFFANGAKVGPIRHYFHF